MARIYAVVAFDVPDDMTQEDAEQNIINICEANSDNKINIQVDEFKYY